MKEEETILNITKTLIEILNMVYTNCHVDMALYQPGLEPLSVIGKSEIEIITKLKTNILTMFSRYSNTKETHMRNKECQNFFGLECDALIKLAERVTSLMPVIIYSKKDEEFAKMPFVKESNEFVEKKLNEICIDMLVNYIRESFILTNDYMDYTWTTDTQESENGEKNIVETSSPQRLSKLFRIFYEGDKNCYCTIADAIRSNQETFVP